MSMKELYLPSSDQKNQLHVVVWEPKKEIKAIMQISHGMVEYVERFDEFAKAMNEYGILVIGNNQNHHHNLLFYHAQDGHFQ